MTTLLRALIVEDSSNDAHLLVRELKQRGFELEYERVESREAMKQALLLREWDIVLCDYSLPQFNAMAALAVLKESGIDIPFLVISGTIDEDTAVSVLKAGADDFIVKGRFARLVPAIERETENARLRRSYREGQTKQESLAENLNLVSAELERFLYTAFHELRSPLVTIKGFLGLLTEDIQSNRPERVESDIERISRAVDKMNELLSGLLKLSQIGRVSYPYEIVDLQAAARETALRLRDQVSSANANIRIAPDLPAVYADPTRLQQVLDILIENAIVHSSDGHAASVEVGAQAGDGEHVIFVKDNGRGIDPRYHARIFNLFEKLDLATEGTGIGLAIVKRIVEIHGGRVWVESEGENKGSTFYFTLPNDRGM